VLELLIKHRVDESVIKVLELANQQSVDQIALGRKDWTKNIEQLRIEFGLFKADFDSFREIYFMALV
jgi:hypothetical protein